MNTINNKNEFVKAVMDHYDPKFPTAILVRAIAEQFWYEWVYECDHKDTITGLAGVLSYEFLDQVLGDCEEAIRRADRNALKPDEE